MPLFENHVGVSVGLNSLRLVELVYTNNEFILENVDELKFDEKLNPTNVDKDFINILQGSFKKIISNNSLTSKNISFSLDPEFFQLLEVPFENTLLKEDLIKHFKWELSKVKPMLDAEEHLIQHIELERPKGSQTHFAAVLYLNKKILTIFNNLAQSNNFQLRYIDYSHSSANIFVRYLNKTFGSSGLSLFVSDESLGAIVLEDYKPVVMRKYQIADSELNNLTDRFLNDLKKDEIEYSPLSYSFLAGVDVGVEQTDMIHNLLGIKTEYTDPFKVVKVNESFLTDVNLKQNPSRFAAAAGIALRLF